MAAISEQFGRVLRGRYRLDSTLGTGGSARVYLATDLDLRRLVAIKLLHPGFANDEYFFRRFQTEARTAAALNHSNVVHVYDWGEDEGEPFLVLEYLSGGSLRHLLDRTSPRSVDVARFIAQAARGLEYAHLRGVIHRDIKPANLLLDESGTVKVADFGIARALADAPMTEPGGVVFGSARYVSPEQAVGAPLTDRSDVYSLALVCWEALVGRPAFDADTMQATMMARVGLGTLPSPPELGALAEVIGEATAAEPSDRIDAARLAVALEKIASVPPGELDRSAPPSPISHRSDVATPVDPLDDTSVIGPEHDVTDDLATVAVHAKTPSTAPRRRIVRWLVAIALVIALGAGGGAAYVHLVVYGHVVPRLIGMPVAAAESAAANNAIAIGHRSAIYSSVRIGDVVSQTLAPGTHVKSGSKVDVVVSKGLRPVPVPALVGLTRAAARAAIVAGHLNPHTTLVYSESVSPGIVVNSTPEGGTAGFGSTVSIEVSRGPAPRTIPNLSGQSSAAATSALSALKLAPTESAIYSPTVPSGMVISTVPAAGTSGVPVGTGVTLVVSKGPQPVSVPSVAGDTIADAVAALRATGLNVVEQIGPPFATKATTTNPGPGSSVLPGTSITLYVA